MAETTRRRRTTAADEPDEAPFVPRRKGPREEPTDRQVETTERLEPFEVLTEAPNGHRTVARVRAVNQAAAEKAVADGLNDGRFFPAAPNPSIGP
jgi:hypothetical protein